MSKLSVEEQLAILGEFWTKNDENRKLFETQLEKKLCGPFSLHTPSEEE